MLQARALLDGGSVVETEQVILAAGRTPATAGLGLDAIGVTPADTGALAVDPRCRVMPGCVAASVPAS